MAVHQEQISKERNAGMNKVAFQEERKRKFFGRPLHGQFVGSTEESIDGETCEWLKKGKLKKG